MSLDNLFNPKKTTNLYELKVNFNILKNLLAQNNLPNVLLLSGDKGIGKSTLVNHLMYYIFDKQNYNTTENNLFKKSNFYNQFLSNAFSNIIYLSGESFKNVKIEDIRILIDKILKTSLNDGKRFIILDDVELFNNNALNALLKIIEKPNKYTHFVLINNRYKPLLSTIKSRCIEFKIILKNDERSSIISSLMNNFNQDLVLDKDLIKISPGNLLKYNYFFKIHKINPKKDFSINLKKILDLYKKDKDFIYRDILLYFTEYYFENLKHKNVKNSEEIIKNRSHLLKNINNFFFYNLNQKTLLNTLDKKQLYE